MKRLAALAGTVVLLLLGSATAASAADTGSLLRSGSGAGKCTHPDACLCVGYYWLDGTYYEIFCVLSAADPGIGGAVEIHN